MRFIAALLLCLVASAAESRCWNGENVSWYVDKHTSSGEPYSHRESTCAHRTARFGTKFRVTDKRSGKSTVCRVNDRGPNKWTKCELDLNRHAAKQIGIERRGVATAKIERVTELTERAPTQIIAHPAGCPSRAFCGCGASIEVFGRNIRELWLASAWFKFPRAEPAPGMVAVRRHHVFVIREVMARGLVLAYDANSGGRKTRVHVRSLAGFTVVDPRGSRYASAG